MRAVVRGGQVVAQLDRADPLDHLADQQRVAQRLAHLLAGRGRPRRCAASSGRTPSPAARDCAISFSWCGKTRSSPPPWMSNAAPRYLRGHRRALQVPARPARPPRASSHDGSPGLAPFHSAKSRGSRLRRRVGVGGGLHLVDALPGQRAVRRPGAHVEVHVAARRRRRGRASISRCISSTISGTWPVARGSYVGGRQPSDVVRPGERALVARGDQPSTGRPRLAALREDLVVDVGDVADEGDVVAAARQPAAQHVEGHARSGCGRCAAAPGRWRRTGRPTPCPASSGTKSRTDRASRCRRGAGSPAQGTGAGSAAADDDLLRRDPDDDADVVGALVRRVRSDRGTSGTAPSISSGPPASTIVAVPRTST